MRKLSSIAGAALLAVTAFASPASAQSGSAGGSCGTSAGAYGMTDLNSTAYGSGSHGVPSLFYTVNYNVPSPTTIGVIVRYNGELESQVAVASFTSDGQPFNGAIRANISPDAQGGGNGIDVSLRGRSDGGPSQGDNQSGNGQGGRAGRGGPATQGSATQAGILPGEYVFYVYTGSRGDVYNVKDGTVARNAFIADESGYLGMFSCGVSTDQGSGPG